MNKPFSRNRIYYVVAILTSLFIAPCVFAASGCDNLSGTPIHTQVNWQLQVKPIINDMLGGYCTSCHSGGSPAGNLDLSDADGLDVLYRIVGDIVLPGDPAGSELFIKINCAVPDIGMRMPPGGFLSMANQELIYDWIEQGAYGENPAKPISRDFMFRDGAESIRIMK